MDPFRHLSTPVDRDRPGWNIPLARAELTRIADRLAGLRMTSTADEIRAIVRQMLVREVMPRPGRKRRVQPAAGASPDAAPIMLSRQDEQDIRKLLTLDPTTDTDEVCAAYNVTAAAVEAIRASLSPGTAK